MSNPIPVVRVILQNSHKEILFLKRMNTNYGEGKWNLPGGKIESGQTAEETCKKEIKEETGLDISNIKLVLRYKDTRTIKVEETTFIVFYFTADFSGEIKINEESSKFRWVRRMDIESLNIAFKEERRAIIELMNNFII